MRHILQGFTMFLDGMDFGIDTEEVDLPVPKPLTQQYRGGGQDLGMNMPMSAIEELEVTVKMAGQNPEIMKRTALAPGRTSRITFRGGVLTEGDGRIVTHMCIVEGAINASSRDRWQRGEKSGFEFVTNGIKYFRYEADSTVIHELQAWPPKRIVNGIDQLAELNAALGY